MPTVALAGNPNCGKTSIFNALTGARHHVGNWPGVTVEKRSGHFSCDGQAVEVVDLPGTYSLSAQSEDERIAAAFLLSPEVDVIVNVLDASNLERNLYLTTQLLELGKPLVFALNMVDDARRRGVSIDPARLEALLGGPVLPTVGNRAQGIEALKHTIAAAAHGNGNVQRASVWPATCRGGRACGTARTSRASWRNSKEKSRGTSDWPSGTFPGGARSNCWRERLTPRISCSQATRSRPSTVSAARAERSWSTTWAPTARRSLRSGATASSTAS